MSVVRCYSKQWNYLHASSEVRVVTLELTYNVSFRWRIISYVIQYVRWADNSGLVQPLTHTHTQPDEVISAYWRTVVRDFHAGEQYHSISKMAVGLKGDVTFPGNASSNDNALPYGLRCRDNEVFR
jgi:hypothetical protein